MNRIFLIIFFFSHILAYAQNDAKIQGNYTNASLVDVFESFEEQAEIQFYYEPQWLDSIKYSGQIVNSTLNEALNIVLKATFLEYLIQGTDIIITNDVLINPTPPIAASLQKSILGNKTVQSSDPKGLIFKRDYLNRNTQNGGGVIEIGARANMTINSSSTLAGYIRDSSTGNPLIGAIIYVIDPMTSAVTDNEGFYSLTLPNGKSNVIIQHLGMLTTGRNIVLFSNGQLDINMEVDLITLQEVIVESQKDKNIKDVQMGVESITVKETKNTPTALGEHDILKIATTMAGVQSVGEGSSGINVRGGKSDQNLMLLNGATIYNASHFFGFFSVFNSDAIQSMDLYKSGMPARYGGRLSSVFDMSSKQSSYTKFKGSGGISPVTARLTLEIPIIKGKSGLMIGGRTTYSNWLLKKVGNAEFSENEVSFSDIIIKYDHAINNKNSFELSGYYSHDDFRVVSDTVFSYSNFAYQNANASLVWNHQYGPKLDGKLSAIFSGYNYELLNDQTTANAFKQEFGIQEISVAKDLMFYPNDAHAVRTGVLFKNYQVSPGSKSPLGSESLVGEHKLDKEQAIEVTAYLSDEFSINNWLTVYGGLRYTYYSNYGPGSVNLYDDNLATNNNAVIGTVTYGDFEKIKSYSGPEIRINTRAILSEMSSIKASYNRTRQYLHTLSNSASLSPTDIWRLSNYHIKPQIADQLAIGYYNNFNKGQVETSVEAYYKSLQNLVDFKVGSTFLLNDNLETAVLQGAGKSYGLELSIKKNGKLNGNLNYTYSRTLIKLDGKFPEEIINSGQYYPTSYDKPHTINLVTNYKLTQRFSFSYNFNYSSGRPVTVPVGVYHLKGIQTVNYSDRNSYRIPDYIRMDIGINLEAGHKLAKRVYSYWSFSIYNVLGRDNAYSIFFDIENGQVQGYKLMIFSKPIPTLSYNFRF